VGRLLLNGAFIARPPADALRIGEKKGIRNKHHTQTEDVLCNPENPVNPDSEIIYGKHSLKTSNSPNLHRKLWAQQPVV
jgi:hypothetical protein